MQKHTLQALMAVLAGGILCSGCINSHRAAADQPVVAVPVERVVVHEAPPPVRQEAVGVAPTGEHVWVAGYWMRGDNRWVWVPGHWEARPRAGVTWVPGQWEKDPAGKGWIWTPGHWE